MPKVILRTTAKRNLKAIGLYIAHDNLARAQSFTDELESVCLSLAELPKRGPLIVARGSNMRRLVHGN